MISIIIPVYNVEKLLGECLDSVLAQTYADLEIILVDDGSTDASPAICDEYARRDGRIRVIHQENRGQSAARNAGLEIARGEFIGFVDSDDYIMPDMYETLMNLHREYDADMCIIEAYGLKDSGEISRRPMANPIRGIEIFDGDDKMDALVRQNRIRYCCWDKLYAREIFRDVRFPEGKICEDLYVVHRLVYAAKRIACSEKKGYIYRLRSGTTMSSRIGLRDFAALDALEAQRDFVAERYPHLLECYPKQLCHYGMMFTIRTAADRFSDPEIDRRLQRLLRQNLAAYLKSGHRRKYKLVALAGAVNLHLARVLVRLVRRVRPGSLNIRW